MYIWGRRTTTFRPRDRPLFLVANSAIQPGSGPASTLAGDNGRRSPAKLRCPFARETRVLEGSLLLDEASNQAMELAERFSNQDFLARIDRLLKRLDNLS